MGMRKSPSVGEHPVLSKTADYALRALLVLGRRGMTRPLPAEAIAELTGTPPNYTSKTLYALARAGLLRSMRGPTGGFALARPPEAITVAEIVDVFADAPRTPQCLLGTGPCNGANPCSAHLQWKHVTHAARAPFLATTIADLLVGAPPLQRPSSTPAPGGAAGAS